MLDTKVKMAEPEPAYESNPEIQQCVREIACKFGLRGGDYFVISRSLFVDGDACRAGVQPLLAALLGGRKRPSNAIVVLSPNVAFRERQSLGQEITAAGGTVVLREIGQTFKDAVRAKFLAYNLSASVGPAVASPTPPPPTVSNTRGYERYKYSEAERAELIRAYETGRDSESVVS